MVEMSRELIRTQFAWESMGRKSENGSLWGGKKKTRVSFSLCPPLLGAKVLLELLGLFFFYLNLPFFPSFLNLFLR